MKKQSLIFMLAIITNVMLVAQNINSDSLRMEIMNDVTILMDNTNQEIDEKLNQMAEELKLLNEANDKRLSNEAITELVSNSNQEVTEKISQMSEEIKLLTEANKQRLSNEAISNLITSVKSESKEISNSLDESRAEWILEEIGKQVEQANKTLFDDILQKIEANEKKLTEETEVKIAEKKDGWTKENKEILENKSSELYVTMTEKIEAENKALLEKINAQNNMILDLQKRLAALESSKEN